VLGRRDRALTERRAQAVIKVDEVLVIEDVPVGSGISPFAVGNSSLMIPPSPSGPLPT
jgi:hypothetical protein